MDLDALIEPLAALLLNIPVVVEFLLPYLALATSVIGLASILARMTPNTTDDKIVAVIKRVLDAIALNPRTPTRPKK